MISGLYIDMYLVKCSDTSIYTLTDSYKHKVTISQTHSNIHSLSLYFHHSLPNSSSPSSFCSLIHCHFSSIFHSLTLTPLPSFTHSSSFPSSSHSLIQLCNHHSHSHSHSLSQFNPPFTVHTLT